MNSHYLLIFLCVLSIRESSVRDELFTVDGKRVAKLEGGIVDEHYFWTTPQQDGMNLIESSKQVGLILGEYFQGENLRVLLRGGQDCMGYYANFSYCLEAAGLTDNQLARMPLARRGQPGHERAASLSYLKEKGIHLVFFRKPYDASNAMLLLKFGTEYGGAEIITRDDSMIERLQNKFGPAVIVMEKK